MLTAHGCMGMRVNTYLHMMIVWFTKISTLRKTPKTSKQTSMRCRPGSVGGWWVFIPRSVNYCESHGSHLRSSPSTTSTGMYWRWLIQQSTLWWLSTSTVHGISTSTRQPRRPTTLVPSSKGISAEHQHRSRNGPTRLSLGQFSSTLAVSGTPTRKQTYTSWIWCNAGMPVTPATTSAAPVASLLCSSRREDAVSHRPQSCRHPCCWSSADVAYNSKKGNAAKFRVPYARTVACRHSFFPDVTRMWNALPSDIVTAGSPDLF